ncbi:MAG TPA: hypothetical protein VEA59_03625 [Patescibacteria group bacterium]|nr:hypothetical protein [Patescibacteria group bacterium]
MAIIIPSILEKTVEDFETIFRKVSTIPEIDRIHVDFCDGVFVDNTTMTIDDLTQLSPAYSWEAHLMVKQPDNFLDYKLPGFDSVIIHYEAYPSEDIHQVLRGIAAAGLKVGMAINPETPVTVLGNYLEGISFAVIMAIHPGRQGNPFIEQTYERVRLAKELYPSMQIEIDGSVNKLTIGKLKQCGADVLNCGSSLVKQPNIRVAYDELKQLI